MQARVVQSRASLSLGSIKTLPIGEDDLFRQESESHVVFFHCTKKSTQATKIHTAPARFAGQPVLKVELIKQRCSNRQVVVSRFIQDKEGRVP